MSLNLFDALALGRPEIRKSMAGTEFAVFADAIPGEWRRALIPAWYYDRASTADERRMTLTSRGWDFWTTRSQLAADIVETLRQLADKDGSVREVRVLTFQRLVTADEWQQAAEAFQHGRSVGEGRTA